MLARKGERIVSSNQSASSQVLLLLLGSWWIWSPEFITSRTEVSGAFRARESLPSSRTRASPPCACTAPSASSTGSPPAAQSRLPPVVPTSCTRRSAATSGRHRVPGVGLPGRAQLRPLSTPRPGSTRCPRRTRPRPTGRRPQPTREYVGAGASVLTPVKDTGPRPPTTPPITSPKQSYKPRLRAPTPHSSTSRSYTI